ncbi:hypothetical protein KU306_02520 [Haloferax larsenii]|uniref:DUF8125 domain-containing protein n=1 Tax=Haloferax larsenii TaxID=302484 RepID=A0ABY5RH77_HALLR|nr:hypothetical protein [Haloferax larsenii]UVE50783.1 hypothetical protein KU306_02520 [Haloferax larsenii]
MKRNDALKLGGIGAAAVYAGDVALPQWTPLAVGMFVIAGIAALVASGKIDDLIPDPPTVSLAVIDGGNDEKVEHWELSEDQFVEMEVAAGSLNPLTESKGESYECYHYDDERNLAVGTWRGMRPHSHIVGHHDIDEALNIINEMMNYLEPEARRGQHIRNNLISIVRILDRQRAAAQNAALEGHLAPNMGGQTIDEVIAETLPEDLLPDRLSSDDASDDFEDDLAGMDIVFDGDSDALEPVDPMLNDGGSP